MTPTKVWHGADTSAFAPPLLASVHVPVECLCSWCWYAPAKALARKFTNRACPSRHRDTWLVPL